MVILGALDKALDVVNNLKSLNQGLSALLRDAIFFVNLHSGTISEAPLQLYSSALLFILENNIIKRLFFQSLPAWIPRPQSWHGDWGYCVRDICRAKNIVEDKLVISPDGNLLAFTDGKYTCEVRNEISGRMSQSIFNPGLIHSDRTRTSILSIHFTEDSKYLVVAVNMGRIVLWDLLAGTALKIINLDVDADAGHDPEFSNSLQTPTKAPRSSQSANSAAFSSDTPDVDPIWTDRRPWDFLLMEFEPKTKTLAAVLYNWWLRPDGAHLSILEAVTIIILWDIKSGNIVNTYRYYNEKAPYACAFSVDYKYLAVALPESTVEIWDLTSHSTLQQLKESLDRPKNKVRSFKFSSNGKHLAIGYKD
ncbi:hypothetical protein TWF569_008479 [Orbilia oligospora]|nr:hypothetical protein TWF569_008479 [Orbilia oligospora]